MGAIWVDDDVTGKGCLLNDQQPLEALPRLGATLSRAPRANSRRRSPTDASPWSALGRLWKWKLWLRVHNCHIAISVASSKEGQYGSAVACELPHTFGFGSSGTSQACLQLPVTKPSPLLVLCHDGLVSPARKLTTRTVQRSPRPWPAARSTVPECLAATCL